jgi:hypothetical protein
MRITLESTDQFTKKAGVECRIWAGETAGGVAIIALIPRIAVKIDAQLLQFEKELIAVPPFTPFIDLRLVF